MSIGWRRWLPEAREGTEMEAIFQRAEVSCGTAAKESINQTDRHSRLSPNGELANLARFACQSVFAQDTSLSFCQLRQIGRTLQMELSMTFLIANWVTMARPFRSIRF